MLRLLFACVLGATATGAPEATVAPGAIQQSEGSTQKLVEPSSEATQDACLLCLKTEEGKCYFHARSEQTWWNDEDDDKPCDECSLCQQESYGGWRLIDDHDWVFAVQGKGCTTKIFGQHTRNCLEATVSPKTGLYESGSQCVVAIKKQKYLNFDAFETELSWDYLKVYDMNFTHPSLLHSWSGEVKPPAKMFQNSWSIAWRADFSNQKKGWKLCSGCPAGSEDSADGKCKCSPGFVCKDRSQLQLPIPGWDISWIKNCTANNSNATFAPSMAQYDCIPERSEFTVYVAVLLSGGFEISAMLVLSMAAYFLPLLLGLYLLAMVAATVSASCNDLDTKDLEAKLRHCFTTLFVVSNAWWFRRRGAIAYTVAVFVLTVVWVYRNGPLSLWPAGIFCLSSLVIYLWHRRVAAAAEEAQQMLSCWSWGCCLCWVCCWNPLGSCLPLTTSETLEKARSADPEPQQEMKEMKEPLIVEETYLSRELAQTEADPPSPLHGLLEKSKNDVVNREREQMHLFKLMIEKYASKSEDRSDRPGTTMLWLAKWTVQQPGAKSGWGKKFHTAMAELLPILYAFLWSLVVARICLEHQDGFIQMPISNSFGDFAPILEDYEFDLGILPTCLAVHFACIALSGLIESREAAQRLREWLYTYGPLEQWKEMYPNVSELADATYARQEQEEAPRAQETDSANICGFTVLRPNQAALPSKRQVVLKVAGAALTLLSMGGTLFYLRYIRYGFHLASGDWQMKSTFAVTKPVLFYLILWLPLVWHRILNGLLFAAECSLLTRTAGAFFDDISAGKESRGVVKSLLETLGWKVQDILSDWTLLIKVGFVLDAFALMTGAMASYRLLVHYEVNEFVPVLVCNCLTLLALVCLQVLPLIMWNAFVEKCASDESNTDPVLFMWLSQGFLKMKVFGLTLSPAYLLGLAVSLAALAEPTISEIVAPPLTEMLTK